MFVVKPSRVVAAGLTSRVTLNACETVSRVCTEDTLSGTDEYPAVHSRSRFPLRGLAVPGEALAVSHVVTRRR